VEKGNSQRKIVTTWIVGAAQARDDFRRERQLRALRKLLQREAELQTTANPNDLAG